MEHAIRWHIKVQMEKDPALYTKFSERLQKILDAHKDHWDVITLELSKLREEMRQGRTSGTSGVPEHIAPFHGLILMVGAIDRSDPESEKTILAVTEAVFEIFRKYLNIANFWEKNSEREKMECEIQDVLEFSGVKELQEKSKHLATELINLAKIREKEIKGTHAG